MAVHTEEPMEAVAPLGTPMLNVGDEEFALFRALIHQQTGISLKEGKRNLLAARLHKRLKELGLGTLTDYYSYLKKKDAQGDELRRMVNCITTNKTSFFREEHHFHYLRDWLKEKAHQTAANRGQRRVRIWSAACSSGEEPYSLAITMLEALPPAAGWDLAILASDIDTDMLGRGESGVYESEGLEGIPDPLKRRYFLRGKGDLEGLVQVKPEVRRLVTFRRINLVDYPWPIHTSFDAIFCRNVIIYFDRETQRRLFERLLKHLAPDGRLFVGHSESLYWMTDLVTPLQHTVYRVRGPESPQ
jgi:chemotaxis protein methyltransferase CheR